MRRADGTFYDLVPPVIPLVSPDHFTMGIVEPSGFLRPIFYEGRMVKVKRHGPGHFEIIPVTIPEYVEYGYDRNITPFNQHAAQYVAGERNR